MFNRSSGGGMGRGGGGQGQGRGKGGGNKPGSGPAGNCICPKCSYKVAHQVSVRCIDQKCPKCGTPLIRE
ncbi:MAG: hypothetical protein JW704_09380 [Anaerolineaceae bacterium]|nr:hypothetical protein [Anaerolineaceae bacterium]MBN2677565.1 hypothetical protein [Anaerolineaceae bacterium]